MASGNSDDFITPLSVAIGMLLTGKGDVKNPKDLVGKSAEGKGCCRKSGKEVITITPTEEAGAEFSEKASAAGVGNTGRNFIVLAGIPYGD